MARRPPDVQQGPGFFDASEEPAVPASGRRLIIEADGRLKYGGDEAWTEKKRQLALMRAGYSVERVLWSDLFAGWPALSARLRPYFASAPHAVRVGAGF